MFRWRSWDLSSNQPRVSPAFNGKAEPHHHDLGSTSQFYIVTTNAKFNLFTILAASKEHYHNTRSIHGAHGMIQLANTPRCCPAKFIPPSPLLTIQLQFMMRLQPGPWRLSWPVRGSCFRPVCRSANSQYTVPFLHFPARKCKSLECLYLRS